VYTAFKEDHMKIIKSMLIATVLLLVPVCAFSSNLGYMRISLIEGDVQVKTPEADDWGPASINGPLEEGDQVWVPEDGRVELQLNTGTYIRLDQNSALQILSMDKDSSQFNLSQGYAYVYYDVPGGSAIQVDTPDASTRAFNRAIFRIDATDQFTYVSVYKGYVETENSAGNIRVNDGETLALGQATSGEIAPMDPPDSWERWNKARNDRFFDRRDMSSRYLPDELRVYSSDFDYNGRWVYVPEYGNCWTPTVVVAEDWAPYRHGRWIWRGGEYVWVGSEPWGWAPYHYGRWAFVDRVGWCWVPPARDEVYWAPGYVGWVRTGDYVAWVPLAPSETYYGRGYYGPHSVNVTNINITQVNVTNVNKNVYVNNGVTVVNRNSFNTASPTVVNVSQNIIRQNIFVKNNISVVGPDIKPTRATYFGSARAVPLAKMPPQHVREMSVRQLKESRPYIKEPERSVLKRGAKSEALPVIKNTSPRIPGQGRPMIQPVRPVEKGRAGSTEPTPAPAPKVERREMIQKPVEKGKPVMPEPAPAPKVERREMIQKPVEKVKPVAPGPPPAPRVERKDVPPVEKGKPGGTVADPGPKGAKKPTELKENVQQEKKKEERRD
jgi:hypothetical protein